MFSRMNTVLFTSIHSLLYGEILTEFFYISPSIKYEHKLISRIITFIYLLIN